MKKLTGNESYLPQIKTEERAGETWYSDIYSTGGLTIIQELASRQMVAYRNNPITSQLPSADLAVYAMSDARALLAVFNIEKIEPGSIGLRKAATEVQEAINTAYYSLVKQEEK